MAEYEFVREIFNNCSGNQMRDVFFEEIETDDIDAYLRQYLERKDVITAREELADGGIRFSVDSSGMLQRFTFTEI
jgi:hypothetical protein